MEKKEQTPACTHALVHGLAAGAGTARKLVQRGTVPAKRTAQHRRRLDVVDPGKVIDAEQRNTL